MNDNITTVKGFTISDVLVLKERPIIYSLSLFTTSPSFRDEIRQGFMGSKVDQKPLAREDVN